MRIHNAEVVSSIPHCVPIKTPFARNATGNHLIKSTSLEKTQCPISGFCYARNRVCDAVFFSFCSVSWKCFIVIVLAMKKTPRPRKIGERVSCLCGSQLLVISKCPATSTFFYGMTFEVEESFAYNYKTEYFGIGCTEAERCST